jgi:ABC-2 type transport system permease protein
VISRAVTPVDAIAAAGGTRINGPGALSGGLRRTAHLAWTLSVLEFRLKFFGSVLGYLWQLGRPLLMFGVYYVVFTQFVDLGNAVPFYAPMLLMGIMLYQFFAEATSASVRAVVDRENLVRKISFPRIVIPVASVLTALLNLGVNLIAVFVFLELSGVPWSWSFLEFPPLVALLVLWCFGLAMLLSALFVRYRDVQPIWEVVSMAMFYATPILYALETVKYEWAKDLIMLNPLALVVQQIRHAMFDPSAESALQAAGSWPKLLIPVAIVFATVALGFWYFNREAPHVAEDL